MEIPCSEDSVNAATAYCACKFPLVALCQVHAAKHTTDLLSFHFPLPLSAPQLVTSRTVYLQLNSWLSRLNGNYTLLREKLQLFAHCEEETEAAFQELLHFVSETKTRIKHELSVRKEGFHAAIEKAISETRMHALEVYEPVDVLSHLLWYSQPWEIEQRQLFTFQANCIQENLPLTFQVALTFDPSLASLSLEKHTTPVTDHIEELTKQLALKEEQVQSLSQQLQETKTEHQRNQHELQGLKLKLQQTEDQLHQLQTDTDTRCLKYEAEVESLNKQCLTQANQLNKSSLRSVEALNRKAQLEASVQTLNERYASLERESGAVNRQVQSQLEESMKERSELERQLKELGQQQEETLHQMQVARTECEAKAQNCASLERERTELQREVQSQAHYIQEAEALFIKSVATAENQLSVLESRLNKWGITSDPPTDFQEPDYGTPQSRAALAKFGSYSDQDDELILVKLAPVTDDTGVYIGQWNSRGHPHGYGKYLWKNGNIYEGMWRNGQITGRGRFIWADDGTVYIGDFVQNKMERFGTYYFANGDEYSGAWVNNTKNGVGACKYGEASQSAGNRYIGEYRDGHMNGIGAYFSTDEGMYVGSWKLGTRHGKGLQVWANGKMYFGDYEDDKASGTGCHMWPNGDVYRGQWKQGMKNGEGRLTHPGAIEEGTWVDNVLRGQGV